MTDRKSIYNGALVFHLGANALDALTDDVPARYVLDQVWDNDGINRCLQMGQWNFAARSARLEYDPSITPEYGYRYAFEKPSDFVRTMAVCSDEYYQSPLRAYTDEIGYWWCDLEQLYVRFVSNHAQYGLDYSKWPANFTSMVETYFALQACNSTTFADKKDKVQTEFDDILRRARSTDAMEQPSRRNPPGSWSNARMAGGAPGDIGSRSRLTG